jgi:hypothetical protein
MECCNVALLLGNLLARLLQAFWHNVVVVIEVVEVSSICLYFAHRQSCQVSACKSRSGAKRNSTELPKSQASQITLATFEVNLPSSSRTLKVPLFPCL